MSLARTDTLDERAAIFASLAARNTVVGVLRIVVPAAGAAAFLLLVLQIYVANTLRQYGVSAIRIDRGALVVDTPQYAGIGSDGARYSASAREARAAIGDPKTIVMRDATLNFAARGAPAVHLTAASASADTVDDVLTVPGTTDLRTDDGITGTLANLSTDLNSGVTTVDGPVALAFPGGATLNAASLRYEGTLHRWTFARPTFVVPALPEPAP